MLYIIILRQTPRLTLKLGKVSRKGTMCTLCLGIYVALELCVCLPASRIPRCSSVPHSVMYAVCWQHTSTKSMPASMASSEMVSGRSSQNLPTGFVFDRRL